MGIRIVREIIIELIAGIIVQMIFIAIAFFAPNISILIGIQANLLRILALIGTIVVGLIIYRIFSIRKIMGRKGFFKRVKRRPSHVAKEGTIEHFGVKWEAVIGSLLRGDFIDGNYYVYIDGPFCPKCDFQLLPKTEPKWLGLSYKQVWHCAQCEKSYERPKRYLYEEDEIVERLVATRLE